MECIFSSLHSSRRRAMKLSALVFTSGLGQVIVGPPPVESIPSADLTDMTSSASSGSGELQRELFSLWILTKSPCAMNLVAFILNGGGGGGSGISGDGGAMVVLSWYCALGFVGRGGFPVLIWRRRGGSGGGGGGGAGGGPVMAFLLKRLLLPPFLNRELSIDEGGGGGGGVGGAVDDD
ncbi:hypothetical protein MIMGU_mgv1a0137732mg, partial [Erythranthe guttata]